MAASVSELRLSLLVGGDCLLVRVDRSGIKEYQPTHDLALRT